MQLILDQHVDTTGRFLLPSTDEINADLAVRQALYQWASQATNKHQLSYELWKRVLLQLTEYDGNRQWVLPLGEEWHINRIGDALEIQVTDAVTVDKGGEQSTHLGTDSIAWSFVREANDDQSSATSLVVRLPPDLNVEANKSSRGIINFGLSRAGDGDLHATSWKITPPWREGRSPVKLGSFLRGQKVPLHLRDSTPIVVCELKQTDSTEIVSSLVAVLVNDKWVVDAAWNSDASVNEGISEASCIILRLDG